MYAQRARGIARKRLPPERLGVVRVSVFGMRERRHGEQESETVPIAGPYRHHLVDDLAELVVPTQEEVARLREPQSQQIARPGAQDGGIAFSGANRVSGEPPRPLQGGRAFRATPYVHRRTRNTCSIAGRVSGLFASTPAPARMICARSNSA